MKRYICAIPFLLFCFCSFGQRNWQFSYNSFDTFVDVSPDYVSGSGGVIDVTVGLTSEHYNSLTQNVRDVLLENLYSSGIGVSEVRSAGYDGDYLLFSASLSIPALPVGTLTGTVSFKGSSDYSYHVVTQGGAILQGIISAVDHENMIPGQFFDIVVTGADNTQNYTLYRYENGAYVAIQNKNPVNGRIVYHLSGPGTYLVGENAEIFCNGTVVAYESEIFSNHFFNVNGGYAIGLPPSGGVGSILFESRSAIDTEMLESYLELLQTEMSGMWPVGFHVEVIAYSHDHKKVRLNYHCLPNFTGQSRSWNTGFPIGRETIRFTQESGGKLKAFCFAPKTNEGRTQLFAVSNGSQYGITYYLKRNGTIVGTAEGTGSEIQITCPDTTGTYMVSAYYMDNDISLSKDMIGEISMPVLLLPVNNDNPVENTNWRRSYTFTDELGHYYVDAVYYNGLGYPDQEVNGFASGNCRKHIYHPIVYDNMLNPDAEVLLPYVKYAPRVSKDDSSLTSQASYYASVFGSPESATAHSVSDYEPSTRHRITRSRQPGRKYADMDKWIHHSYRMNQENEVPKTIGQNGQTDYYPQASLLAHTTTDEDGRMVTEYKDSRDNIRSVRYYSLPADTTSFFDVRYSYDILGRLNSVSTGYAYQYDEYGRLVQKFVPGGGNETYLYDSEDRIVYMAQEKAHYLYEYDDYGRLIRTHVKPERWSGYDTLHDSLSVVPTPAAFDGTLLCETVWGTYPSSAIPFSSVPGIVDSTDVSRKTRGMRTFERVAVLLDENRQDGDMTYVERTYYYDDRARIIQIAESTQLGSLLRTSWQYDYLGNPLVLVEEHERGAGADRKKMCFSYDDRGREIYRSVAYNDETMATVFTSYDDLGRVSETRTEIGELITTENKSYTLQGRLKETAGDYLNQHLYYEDEIPETELPVQYGGNIAGYEWNHGLGTGSHIYSYYYDGRNRLYGADRYDSILDASETAQYNDLGRIMTLSRYDSGNDCVDDLTFSQVGVSCPGYVEVRDDMDEYTRYNFAYDERGNQTEDQLDGLAIAYNVMDKPSRISTSSGKDSYYTYLADGTKTEMACDDGSGYEYVGPFRYRLEEGDLVLDEIPFPGGRIRKDEEGHLTADYYALDYLGSVRTIVNESGDKQVFDYYPYGMLWPECSGAVLEGNQVLFNGKEMQDLAGTNLYDYGARFYNPRTGMWLTRDPQADDYKEYSPYVFCAGNPVNLVDPEGEMWYSYLDDDGEKQYVYSETELSKKEQKNNGYREEGYTLTDAKTGYYYSLFGLKMKADTQEAELYQVLDKMIVRHFTVIDDEDNFIKTNIYVDDFPKEDIAFTYRGVTFSSEFGVISGKRVGDGTIFHSCLKENSSSFITKMPDRKISISRFNKVFGGYWLLAKNGKGINDGFCTVQIKFDKNNASSFINSINNLFHKNLQVQ